MFTLYSIGHPHVVPNLHEFLSSAAEHKSMNKLFFCLSFYTTWTKGISHRL